MDSCCPESACLALALQLGTPHPSQGIGRYPRHRVPPATVLASRPGPSPARARKMTPASEADGASGGGQCRRPAQPRMRAVERPCFAPHPHHEVRRWVSRRSRLFETRVGPSDQDRSGDPWCRSGCLLGALAEVTKGRSAIWEQGMVQLCKQTEPRCPGRTFVSRYREIAGNRTVRRMTDRPGGSS